MICRKIQNAGFTLIELLIVIALLGAFLIGLFATIDPFEQLKKSTDATKSDIAQNTYNALVRMYTLRGNILVSQDIIGEPLTSENAKTLIQTLIQNGELKSNFLKLTQGNATKMYLSTTQDGKTLAVCFAPESKSYKHSTQTVYSALGIIDQNCTQTTCYYCIGENATQDLASTNSTDTETAQIPTTATQTPVPTPTDSPIIHKVMVIDFNPILENQGNKRLRAYKNWSDPIPLEAQFISDIQTASNGYFTYQIVTRLADMDAYPTKNTGYTFTDATYLAALSSQDANARAIINYNKVLTDYDICTKVNNGEIDELWLWGGPWFGYWEAVMAGPGAYVTNAPPITGTSCTKKLHIFGFSYERGIAEMLEDFGHRTEGTMRNAFGGWFSGGNTDWDKFTKGRAFHPNEGMFSYGCGSIHEPFNASGGYDWGNTSTIANTCSAWINYPSAPTTLQTQSCSLWGCTGYGYLKMWLGKLPKASGQTNGKWNNWWKYLGDVN